MKKFTALLMALVLLLTALPVMAEEMEVTANEVDYDKLVIGHTTKLSGNFYSEVFGNNTADIDVWSLLHGYHLVSWDGEMGVYQLEPMVAGSYSVYENEETGNRIFIIALQDDLLYCDGTPITAKDYAFAVMMSAAPQVAQIGGNVNGVEYIVGIDEFKRGETHVLSGVRVPSDYVLEIEIKGEYLPFFYELGLLNFCPYPISAIAPGCELVDDGEGVYLRDIDTQAVPSEIFTAETLAQTLLDAETGYVSHPGVTSGPYMLTGYDRESGVATFDINPYYKGNAQAIKPTIPHLEFRVAKNETVIDELGEGEFGLFNKAVNAKTIDAGRALVMSGEGYSMSNYPRNGFSYVSYRTERPGVDSQAVRQAIAYCLDTDTFVSEYVHNYGLRVHGYYGIGQWMYRLVAGTLAPPVELPENPTAADQQAYDDTLEAWAALNLDGVKHYDLDLEQAEALLVADGWTLNTAGEAFNAETDDVRCKEIDGELVALDFKLIYPEGNEFGSAVQPLFADNLAQIGIKLTADPVPFTQLLEIYYRDVDADVDMIYLASNFTIVFEPSGAFDPADAETGMINRTAITDQELYDLAVDMRMTQPGDVLAYCTKWIAFQERWAEVLPAIPVYSNVYFDFYTAALQNYNVSAELNWSTAIVPAVLSDYMAPEEDEELEDDEFDDGETFEDDEEVFFD